MKIPVFTQIALLLTVTVAAALGPDLAMRFLDDGPVPLASEAPGEAERAIDLRNLDLGLAVPVASHNPIACVHDGEVTPCLGNSPLAVTEPIGQVEPTVAGSEYGHGRLQGSYSPLLLLDDPFYLPVQPIPDGGGIADPGRELNPPLVPEQPDDPAGRTG